MDYGGIVLPLDVFKINAPLKLLFSALAAVGQAAYAAFRPASAKQYLCLTVFSAFILFECQLVICPSLTTSRRSFFNTFAICHNVQIM